MKILLDASTPALIARVLKGHDVIRAAKLGWQELANGELLRVAEREGFHVLITCDQNLRFQQNLTDRKLAIVVLSTNHWPTLRPVAARIATAVDFAQRGQVVTVDIAML